MKKIISILIAAVLTAAITIMSIPVSAASLTVTADGGSGTYMPGDTVAVPIKLTNNPGIWGAEFDVYFDSTALQVYTILNGDFFTEGYGWTNVSTNDIDRVNSRGRYHYIGYADRIDQNITGDGTLCTILFKIDESAAQGSYSIEMKLGTGVFVDVDDHQPQPVFEKYDIQVTGTSADNSEPKTVTLPSSKVIAVTEVVEVDGTKINQPVTDGNGVAETTVVAEEPATGSPRDVVSQKAANGELGNDANAMDSISADESVSSDNTVSTKSSNTNWLIIVLAVLAVIVVGALVVVIVIVNKKGKNLK